MPKTRSEEFEDYLNSVEAKNWLERVRREMFPKIAQSRICVSILDSKPDPKLCVELGAAILFGKPLLILAIKGREVPPKLRQIADAVVEVDDPRDPEAIKRIHEAVSRFVRETS